MTNRDPIPSDAVLVAIDIAKVRNEVLIEAFHHKRLAMDSLKRRLSCVFFLVPTMRAISLAFSRMSFPMTAI